MLSSNGPWPGISVVIPTWNGLSLLAVYLPSVRDALEDYPGPWECLIIDDGGTDDTAQELPAIFPRAVYLRRERNEGFPAAANAGFEAAKHPLVLLLNNDIRVNCDFLRPLAERFRPDRNPEAVKDLFAVVSLQINPDRDDRVNAAFDGCRVLRFDYGDIKLVNTVRAATGESARPTDLAHGGCSLFSRDKVHALGCFSLLFSPFYFEDTELSVQALRRGWRIVYEPRSVVWHRPNSTTYQRSAAVSVILWGNGFLFNWLVLAGAGEWTRHIAWIIPRLLKCSLQGQTEYVQGLWRALWCLPEVGRQRQQRGRGAHRSVQEIARAT